jgi:hypothetical protein
MPDEEPNLDVCGEYQSRLVCDTLQVVDTQPHLEISTDEILLQQPEHPDEMEKLLDEHLEVLLGSD